MQDRPTARELLADIAELLENDVVPVLSGPLQHQVRVAGNLCRIVERELALGADADATERRLLAALLGHDGDALSLNAELAEVLRENDDPSFEKRAWEVLVAVVRLKLAVAKPGHDSYDFAAET